MNVNGCLFVCLTYDFCCDCEADLHTHTHTQYSHRHTHTHARVRTLLLTRSLSFAEKGVTYTRTPGAHAGYFARNAQCLARLVTFSARASKLLYIRTHSHAERQGQRRTHLHMYIYLYISL